MTRAMRNRSIVLVAVSGLVSGACGGESGGGKPSCTSLPVTVDHQPTTCGGASFTVQDASNYAFTSAFKLPPVTVKSMSNLTIDWSAVTQDFVGHPVDPVADLNTVLMLMWELPLDDLETKLNADKLDAMYLFKSPPPVWPAQGETTGGSTSAQLYDFTVQGAAIPGAQFDMYLDPVRYPPAGYSYVAAAATGTDLGRGFRMMQAFRLDPGASGTTVPIKNDSVRLTCEVSLRNLTITGVPAGTSGLMLDFSELSKNGLGATFEPSYITSAVVGHYAETPEELEKKFLDLDLVATEYYRANIPVPPVLDFTTLMDENGVPFHGVNDEGTWLVGLFCGGCRNPAPWYMTILKPCTP